MDITRDRLLVIASEDLNNRIREALSIFPGMDLSLAGDWESAAPRIHARRFALILLETPMDGIEVSQVAKALSKPDQASPLLILSDSGGPEPGFLDQFPELLVDFLPRDAGPDSLGAKIRIFLALHQNRTAVSQSIDELNRIYERIMAQHRTALKEENLRKEALNLSSAAATQMGYPLKKIRAGIYTLLRNRDLSPAVKNGANRIRHAAKQLEKMSQKINEFPGRLQQDFPDIRDGNGMERPCRILYAINSKEEFHIFQHYLNRMVKHRIFPVSGIEEAMEAVATDWLDIIFIDHLLSDGTGLEFLSRLTRLGIDTPVVYTTDKASAYAGAESLARGALGFYIKEDISSKNIRSIIFQALDQSRMIREMTHARDRIVVISRRDRLTRLYNRRCFDKALGGEISKALRYDQDLAVLLIGFKNIKALAESPGPDVQDMVLAACAGIIQSMVRDIDQVCRFGDDEFGIILPGTGSEGAGIMAGRLLDHLSGQTFKSEDSPSFQLILNMGIAACSGESASKEGESRESLKAGMIKLALEALEQAERQGDNTIKQLRMENP